MNLLRALSRQLLHRIVRDEPSTTAAPREAYVSPHDPAEPGKSPTRWLCPQEIVLDVDVWDARRAMELAAEFIGRAHGLDPEPIFRALWRREQVGSTALGQGIAIPHARIAGIGRPLTLFMRTRHAIVFGAPDHRPVTNFLVIMVPADGATDDHLQLLALIAQMFQDGDFRACLAASTTAWEVERAFVEFARRPAATGKPPTRMPRRPSAP